MCATIFVYHVLFIDACCTWVYLMKHLTNIFDLLKWLKPNFVLELKISDLTLEVNISLLNFATSSHQGTIPKLSYAYLTNRTVLLNTNIIVCLFGVKLFLPLLTSSTVSNLVLCLATHPLKFFHKKQTFLP